MSSPGDQGPVRLRIEGRAAHVLIDRAATRNALSPEVIEGLHNAHQEAVAAECTVFVLRGAGGVLSSGADLTYLRSVLDNPEATREYIGSIGAVVDEIEASQLISVCVVDGYALAGGCEIMLACDLAVAGSTAALGDRHMEYGLLPGAGGSVRMARAVPAVHARRLLFTGDIVGAEEAFRMGLVSHVAPEGELDATVEGLTDRLTSRPADALREMKRLYRNAAQADTVRADLDEERETLLRHLSGPTVREGLAAFFDRRMPQFN